MRFSVPHSLSPPFVTSFVFSSCFCVRGLVDLLVNCVCVLCIYVTRPVNVMKSERPLRAATVVWLRIPYTRSSDHSCAFVVVEVVDGEK
jgi:hypothetical protein